MDEIEEKLGAILGNPQIMSQIMSMAQAFNQQNQATPEPAAPKSQPPKPSPPQPTKNIPSFGKNEVEMIRRLSNLAQQTGLDRQQQNLIKALQPYLGKDRLGKLEKAMHAAKLAKFASSALDQSSSQLKIGR